MLWCTEYRNLTPCVSAEIVTNNLVNQETEGPLTELITCLVTLSKTISLMLPHLSACKMEMNVLSLGWKYSSLECFSFCYWETRQLGIQLGGTSNPVLVNQIALKLIMKLLSSSGAVARLGLHHTISQQHRLCWARELPNFLNSHKWEEVSNTKCCGGHASLQGNPCDLPLYHHTTVESWDPQEHALPPASRETVLGVAFPLCSPGYPHVP